MKLITTLAVAVLLAAPTLAAPCRDGKGKFVKCSPAAASKGALPSGVTRDAKGKCHAAGGKFVACPK